MSDSPSQARATTHAASFGESFPTAVNNFVNTYINSGVHGVADLLLSATGNRAALTRARATLTKAMNPLDIAKTGTAGAARFLKLDTRLDPRVRKALMDEAYATEYVTAAGLKPRRARPSGPASTSWQPR